jgi:hypothetical protein
VAASAATVSAASTQAARLATAATRWALSSEVAAAAT